METLGGLGSLLVMLTRFSLEGSTWEGWCFTTLAELFVWFTMGLFPSSLYIFSILFSCTSLVVLLFIPLIFVCCACTFCSRAHPLCCSSEYAYGTTLREAFDRNNV